MSGTMTAMNSASEICGWRHAGHFTRVCPIAPVAFVLKVMLALGDMPPDGILADRLQADRTGLLFLRGCAKLLPHAAKIGLLSLRNGSLRETRM